MNLEEMKSLGLIETIDARHGRMSFLRTDLYIAQSFGLYREFSQSEIDLWQQLVEPGDTVVTAGANIGAHVVWFGKRVGEHGKVITAEPQRALYEILEENIAQNGLEQVVERHPVALGKHHAGKARLPRVDYRYPFNFGSIGVSVGGTPGIPGVVVDLASVDHLVAGRKVKLLHLDVEGFELEAIAGARETIASSRPYLYVEADREELRPKIWQTMRLLGYEPLLHEAPLFNPENHAANRVDVWGNIVSISYLGIPKAGRP